MKISGSIRVQIDSGGVSDGDPDQILPVWPRRGGEHILRDAAARREIRGMAAAIAN